MGKEKAAIRNKRKPVTTFLDTKEHAELKLHLWLTKTTLESFARDAIRFHMEREGVRRAEEIFNGPRKRRKKVAV